MDQFVYRFDIAWRKTILMAVSNKKGDVLFAINALADNFFDNEEDNDAYSALIEE